MSVTAFEHQQGSASVGRSAPHVVAPGIARPLMVAVLVAAFASGALATDAASATKAAAAAGDDLTRLMRFMAAIKASMAVGAAGAAFWRLGYPVGLPRLLAYAVACAAMAAGPGLIWGMTHIGLGAVLLHGGLIATVVLVWRDPTVVDALRTIVAKRRSSRSRSAGEGRA